MKTQSGGKQAVGPKFVTLLTDKLTCLVEKIVGSSPLGNLNDGGS